MTPRRSAPTPSFRPKLEGFGTSIFSDMTALAQRFDAINLGQGFPDFEGPQELLEVAQAAIAEGRNQYCRSFGIPELNGAIADHRERFYGLRFDPTTEITATHGATEALAATILALVGPGDEVIVFEPFYDGYPALLALAGAQPRFVRLREPEFSLDVAELDAAIGPRTRAILLNTPHNPTGKVFRAEELDHIAALCDRHDLLLITDEVYEHLVYEGEHRPPATDPRLRNRTVMISSTGKTFSLTGWKVGYVCAGAELTAAIRAVHQFLTFCTPAPFQLAMAHALRMPAPYFTQVVSDYRDRRDRLCDGLSTVGFDVHVPAGTYFVCADIRPLGFDDDLDFCRRLPAEVGVAAIPNSAFYDARQTPCRHLVRFAFCKTDAVLDAGIGRLQRRLATMERTPP